MCKTITITHICDRESCGNQYKKTIPYDHIIPLGKTIYHHLKAKKEIKREKTTNRLLCKECRTTLKQQLKKQTEIFFITPKTNQQENTTTKTRTPKRDPVATH